MSTKNPQGGGNESVFENSVSILVFFVKLTWCGETPDRPTPTDQVVGWSHSARVPLPEIPVEGRIYLNKGSSRRMSWGTLFVARPLDAEIALAVSMVTNCAIITFSIRSTMRNSAYKGTASEFVS